MTTHATSTDPGWHGYALTGRPDLLNYLRRGDLTWSDLWRFYRTHPADPSAVIRLMGLFHAFLSQDFDAEGCVLDEDGRVYPRLHEWAELVVACREFVPEPQLRESLAGLLEQSLISPLYFEAVFNAYLEAELQEEMVSATLPPASGERRGTSMKPKPRAGHLSVQLDEFRWSRESRWRDTLSVLVGRHYDDWDRAYALALGEEQEDWLDEGGEG